MKLQHQVTSLDLSKRLKELGVEQSESLYSWKPFFSVTNDSYIDWNEKSGQWVVKDNHVYQTSQLRTESWYPRAMELERMKVSAFTTSELGEMLPTWIYTVKFNDENNDFYCWSDGESDYGIEIEPIHADTEANARALMLVYLLENDIIKL